MLRCSPRWPLAARTALLVCLAAPSSHAGQEILHLQDGRFNNAPRLVEDFHDVTTRLVYKTQFGTDTDMQQIAAGVLHDPDIWSFGDVTSNVSSKELPDVAVTANGVAHLVWRESLGGGAWQIFYANDAAGSWSSPRQITFDAFVKGAPRIAADADTVFVHVAYSTLGPGARTTRSTTYGTTRWRTRRRSCPSLRTRSRTTTSRSTSTGTVLRASRGSRAGPRGRCDTPRATPAGSRRSRPVSLRARRRPISP